MTKRARLLALALFTLAATLVQAQSVTLPPSGGNQRQTVTQEIGPVKVSIDYSSPRVVLNGKDRRGQIWGKLVPYGPQKTLGYGTCTECPWRGGANFNTIFTVSQDVKVEGQPLKAGAYGLHFIPDPNEWTVIFSNNSTSWGSFFYDPAEDALRVKVKPQKAEYRDFLTYDFTDRELDHATVALKWEELAVPFTISVDDVPGRYIANLRNELRGAGSGDYRNWQAAAAYALQHGDKADALKWAQTSVNGVIGKEELSTLMTLADAQDANGLTADAEKSRDKAYHLPATTALDIHLYARGLQQQGKNEEAMKVFELNAKLHPNTWPVSFGLARGSLALGRKDDAKKYGQDALKQAPDESSKKVVQQFLASIG
jgi:Protein of unknown function (DUF2911)